MPRSCSSGPVPVFPQQDESAISQAAVPCQRLPNADSRAGRRVNAQAQSLRSRVLYRSVLRARSPDHLPARIRAREPTESPAYIDALRRSPGPRGGRSLPTPVRTYLQKSQDNFRPTRAVLLGALQEVRAMRAARLQNL